MIENLVYPIGFKVNHFRQARRLTLATSQVAGPLWEFQWKTTAGHICLIKRILLNGVQTGNATAEELQFNLKIARSFTAVDNTNVTSILRSGDMQQLSTKYGASVLNAFVESSAASAASGGTMTLDTDAICNGSYVTIATATTTFDGADDSIIEFSPFTEAQHFLRLDTNEGFVISLGATKGATQGFILNMEVAWAECLKPTTTVGGL